MRADSVDTFNFQVTHPNFVFHTLTWQADSSPSPIWSCGICHEFRITANLWVDGASVGPETIDFANNLGFAIPTFWAYSAYGGPLWTGTVNSPTFTPGIYTLRMSDLPSPEFGILTISAPEPGAFSLFFVGLLAWLSFALLSSGLWARSKQAQMRISHIL
jgi:hypothetical protein